MGGLPITVSPQSATDALSGAGGGVGAHTFYIGGNPNIAAVFGGNNQWLLLGLAALALVYVLKRR